MIWRTSIDSAFLKKTLYKGFFFYFFGAVLLAQAFFWKPTSLKYGGYLFFFAAVGLITAGLLPYKKLKKSILNPDEIEIQEDRIIYRKKNQARCAFPISSVKSIYFEKNDSIYGMGISFNDDAIRSIDFSNVENLITLSKNESFQSDLFLPFFSLRCTEELKEFLDSRLDDIMHLDQSDNSLILP